MTRLPGSGGDAAPERADLIGPNDPQWRETLGSVTHDFYHLPEYCLLEADRLGGEVVAAYVNQPGVRLLIPLIRRSIPHSSAEDLVSPYGYPSLIAEFSDSGRLRSALLTAVDSLREQGFVSMFVRLHPILDFPSSVLDGVGRLVEHGQTVSIDLRQDDAQQWADMRPNYRKALRRSESAGLRAFIDGTGQHLDRFVDLYTETMRRRNAARDYFFSSEYLVGLWEQLPASMHLGVVEAGDRIVCAGLFGESRGIVQYHLSGTGEDALEFSPLKVLLDGVRRWATQRKDSVLHLGGGIGGAEDSLMQFKSGFSSQRRMFKTWRVVLDEQRYANLSGRSGDASDFFPAYRAEHCPAL